MFIVIGSFTLLFTLIHVSEDVIAKRVFHCPLLLIKASHIFIWLMITLIWHWAMNFTRPSDDFLIHFEVTKKYTLWSYDSDQSVLKNTQYIFRRMNIL